MKWQKLESKSAYTDFALRTEDHQLIIMISQYKNKKYYGRIYKPFDKDNIFRSLVSEYVEGETLEATKFLSILKAKEVGWNLDLLDKTILK
tara:strand:+ start:42 stop:314 length:273 start_codon:yes stop_codon:yes gene_type:complete